MAVETETLEERSVEEETENLEKWVAEQEADWEDEWRRDCEIKMKYVEVLLKKEEDARKQLEEDDKKREEECRKKKQEEADRLFEEVMKEAVERSVKRPFVSDREKELHLMIRQWILEGRLKLSERFCSIIQEVLNYDDLVKSRKLGEAKSAAALLINQNPNNVISGSNNCQCLAARTKCCPCHAVGSKECNVI